MKKLVLIAGVTYLIGGGALSTMPSNNGFGPGYSAFSPADFSNPKAALDSASSKVQNVRRTVERVGEDVSTGLKKAETTLIKVGTTVEKGTEAAKSSATEVGRVVEAGADKAKKGFTAVGQTTIGAGMQAKSALEALGNKVISLASQPAPPKEKPAYQPTTAGHQSYEAPPAR